jgi:hypothetical protein
MTEEKPETLKDVIIVVPSGIPNVEYNIDSAVKISKKLQILPKALKQLPISTLDIHEETIEGYAEPDILRKESQRKRGYVVIDDKFVDEIPPTVQIYVNDSFFHLNVPNKAKNVKFFPKSDVIAGCRFELNEIKYFFHLWSKK